MNRLTRALWIVFMLASLAWAQATSAAPDAKTPPDPTKTPPGQTATGGRAPNILFIIMDDVGIDQMTAFGYGGDDPPKTPNINAIAKAGVRFRNAWAMPECSPSRAVFFEGRFPLRTNVMSALLDDDLANSQVSPFEVTTPKVIKKRGYDSANFGKFHIAVNTNNPYGMGVVAALGWDYFDGFLDGAPHPIDESAGGVAPKNPDGTLAVSYTCGFVPNSARPGGADTGACHFIDGSCRGMSTADFPTPGFSCMEQGGIFWPHLTCPHPTPNPSAFENQNAYYAWQRVINVAGRPPQVITPDSGDPSTRRYLGEVTTDSAVSWITTEKKGNKKWMVTVAYPQIHAPYQQVPPSLLSAGSDDLTDLDCTPNLDHSTGIANYHPLSNQMLESMDTEIGRLLVQTGLASYNADGSLNYQPQNTDTMVILLGDNGTYGAGVKDPPFDPTRAKGFVYQTGVWVPLIVAGPMVNSPDREVRWMVNIADLFQLFGEIAGIDVRQVVPDTHILDSQPMLAYLTNPNQLSIRQTNFTQTGANIHISAPAPCVIKTTGGAVCVQLMAEQAVCHLEGGVWYGPPDPNSKPDPGTQPAKSCCAVKNEQDPTITIQPDFQAAIRNDSYKLVQLGQPDCSAQPDPDTGQFPDVILREFYQINEDEPPTLELDKEGTAKCADTLVNGVVTQNCPNTLDPALAAIYNSLFTALADPTTGILNSEPPCPGDGNLDKVVDQKDIQQWKIFSQTPPEQGHPSGLTSSWYDFKINGKYDGMTDNADLAFIQQHLGIRCTPK
jgi:hypothetical protein